LPDNESRSVAGSARGRTSSPSRGRHCGQRRTAQGPVHSSGWFHGTLADRHGRRRVTTGVRYAAAADVRSSVLVLRAAAAAAYHLRQAVAGGTMHANAGIKRTCVSMELVLDDLPVRIANAYPRRDGAHYSNSIRHLSTFRHSSEGCANEHRVRGTCGCIGGRRRVACSTRQRGHARPNLLIGAASSRIAWHPREWRRIFARGAASSRVARHLRAWRGIFVRGAASSCVARHPRAWRGILVRGAASSRRAPRPRAWRGILVRGAANCAVSDRRDAGPCRFREELLPISLVTLLPRRIKGCLGGHRLAAFHVTGGFPSAAVDCRGTLLIAI
jgi:hypothetical protein